MNSRWEQTVFPSIYSIQAGEYTFAIEHRATSPGMREAYLVGCASNGTAALSILGPEARVLVQFLPEIQDPPREQDIQLLVGKKHKGEILDHSETLRRALGLPPEYVESLDRILESL